MAAGCDAVHPGYGFLSESAAFAERCEAAGLVFVGPSPEVLAVLGDKAAARRLAAAEGIPVLAGTETATTEDALAFLEGLGPGATVMVKAVAGGGGRGMRMAAGPDELVAAIERCRSEAATAFGRGDVYVEQYLPGARHVEVQILGDGSDGRPPVGAGVQPAAPPPEAGRDRARAEPERRHEGAPPRRRPPARSRRPLRERRHGRAARRPRR